MIFNGHYKTFRHFTQTDKYVFFLKNLTGIYRQNDLE